MVASSGSRFHPVSYQSERADAPAHTGLFILMLLTLVWAPIPIGSNRAWSVAILEIISLMLMGAWALGYVRRPFDVPDALRHSRIPLVLLSMWLLYPLVQLAPLPVDLVEMLGSRASALYRELPIDSEAGFAFLSLDRGATFAGFLWQWSLVAIFFCVLSLTTTPGRLRALMIVMFLAGFSEAVYGLLIYFGGDELGFWNPGYSSGTVSGTYVNQNHFAGLMELTIPLGLGLLLCYQEQQRSRLRLGNLINRLIVLTTGRGGLILFCVLVMIAALILTTSRGGTGALVVGISTAVLLAAMKRGFKTREVKLSVVAAVLVVVAIFWIGPGQFSGKIQSAGLTSQRGDLREISYRMVIDSPLFGTGVGTYRWVFPGYKDERFGGNFYEHAHNDFLEILGEQGIIGFALLASGVLVIFLRLVRAYGRRRDPLMRGALFAAIAGCVSLLVHGLVDFNLQIPANAAYFVSLLGLGLVAGRMESDSRTG